MYIERAGFHQKNPTGDAYVQGQIAIEGEFTVQEWNKLREVFIALGLFQLKHGRKLSDCIPSRREILDAFRDDKLPELAKKYPGFNWQGGPNKQTTTRHEPNPIVGYLREAALDWEEGNKGIE